MTSGLEYRRDLQHRDFKCPAGGANIHPPIGNLIQVGAGWSVSSPKER